MKKFIIETESLTRTTKKYMVEAEELDEALNKFDEDPNPVPYHTEVENPGDDYEIVDCYEEDTP